MAEPQIMIIGASARAAAFSALRAGLRPRCADLFADDDLGRVAEVVRLGQDVYPYGFVELFRHAPNIPWLYTGALENQPALVRSLSRLRPLLGNPADVLRRVRDPQAWSGALLRHSLACPEASRRPPRDRPGVWLRKPRKGAAGMGISVWRPGSEQTRDKRGHYFQSLVAGPAHSAVYLGCAKQSRLLGVTRQLVGEPWLHAGPFRYCGSIGPAALTSQTTAALVRIGDVLVGEFELRGLFGVDFILSEGVPYPVEVNPRYTASIEILEHALGVPTLALHCVAFTGNLPPETIAARPAGCLGKAILFAPGPVVFPATGPWCNSAETFDPWQVPSFADIPAPGCRIEAGQPIFTLLARGVNEQDCLAQLQTRTAQVGALLGF